MKYFIYSVLLFLLYNTSFSQDTLKSEKPKTLSVKSNIALLLFRGFSLQTEYIANNRTGVWIEGTRHCEEHSVFNTKLKETNFLCGINHYKLHENCHITKPHNGVYLGPYIKYRRGYYCLEKETSYSALFLGLQGGMQSVSKQNIVFVMGMGYGVGYFVKKGELTYSTLFEKYHLPILDFRANISLGYMF